MNLINPFPKSVVLDATIPLPIIVQFIFSVFNTPSLNVNVKPLASEK